MNEIVGYVAVYPGPARLVFGEAIEVVLEEVVLLIRVTVLPATIGPGRRSLFKWFKSMEAANLYVLTELPRDMIPVAPDVANEVLLPCTELRDAMYPAEGAGAIT